MRRPVPSMAQDCESDTTHETQVSVASDDLALRPLRESDYPVIISHVNDWWGGRNVAPMLPRLFFEHFASTSFVLADRDQLAGFVCGFVSASRPGEGHIHFVGVDPRWRSARCGRRLYEAFFARMRELGVSVVHAVTSPWNEPSLAFHRALGFRVVSGDGMTDSGVSFHREYDGPGGDRLLFELRLDAPSG
jgi:ribosomal protein S18 acetylase RimI-like enzyme